jgi:hypothetical protein
MNKKYYLNEKAFLSSTPSIRNQLQKQLMKYRYNNNLSDQEGLDKAYAAPNSIYFDGNKMYIAGTKWTRDPDRTPTVVDEITTGLTGLEHLSLQDAWDDLKIPLFKTQDADRYQTAAAELKKHPEINTLVSHSLGGAVALQLNKDNNNKFSTITYGAPVFQLNKQLNNHRFRHPGDPVSYFDFGAKNVPIKNSFNPLDAHSYAGYNNQGKTK